jgi:hypothetical protein
MTSGRITAFLLCACIAIPAMMYVRDLGASPLPLTVVQAQFDARRLLTTTDPQCGNNCSVETLGMSAAHTWRFRLTAGAWHRCYDVNPGTFGFNTTTGFIGVKAAPCRLS